MTNTHLVIRVVCCSLSGNMNEDVYEPYEQESGEHYRAANSGGPRLHIRHRPNACLEDDNSQYHEENFLGAFILSPCDFSMPPILLR